MSLFQVSSNVRSWRGGLWTLRCTKHLRYRWRDTLTISHKTRKPARQFRIFHITNFRLISSRRGNDRWTGSHAFGKKNPTWTRLHNDDKCGIHNPITLIQIHEYVDLPALGIGQDATQWPQKKSWNAAATPRCHVEQQTKQRQNNTNILWQMRLAADPSKTKRFWPSVRWTSICS